MMLLLLILKFIFIVCVPMHMLMCYRMHAEVGGQLWASVLLQDLVLAFHHGYWRFNSACQACMTSACYPRSHPTSPILN